SLQSPYVVGRSWTLSSPVWICAAYICYLRTAAACGYLLRRIIGTELARGNTNPPYGVGPCRKGGLSARPNRKAAPSADGRFAGGGGRPGAGLRRFFPAVEC